MRGLALKKDAVLCTQTADVLKTSEIENEFLDADQVRSSLARGLGIYIGAPTPANRGVEGIVEMMLDVTQSYAERLTEDRLFGWHAALFPTGRSGMSKIIVGTWRDDASGAMQVVSAPVGRHRVHFEAPPGGKVPAEMKAFVKWLNAMDTLDPVL